MEMVSLAQRMWEGLRQDDCLTERGTSPLTTIKGIPRDRTISKDRNTLFTTVPTMATAAVVEEIEAEEALEQETHYD